MGDNMRVNKKIIMSIALCLCAVFMAVGYAAFKADLTINGTANVTSTWDVSITNITTYDMQGGAYNIEEPSYNSNVAKFYAAVINPGDAITYNVTIKNKGTISAVLGDYKITESGSESIVYLVSGINKGDILEANETVTITVLVQYNNNVGIEPPTTRVRRINLDLDWIQYVNQELSSGTYTVKFYANGGSGSKSNVTCTVGAACTIGDQGFEKANSRFLGWALSANGPVYTNSTSLVGAFPANSGDVITFYAKWGTYNHFSYTGAVQTYTVTQTGKYALEVWGAEGGWRTNSSVTTNTYSGKGGYTYGEVNLKQGDILYIYVGGDGNNHKGFNGGALSGCNHGNGCTSGDIYSGGASDIRINVDSLYARVIVAGGGGSVGAPTKKGGAGGGTNGETTTENYTSGGCSTTICGQGGSQYLGGTGSTTAGYVGTAGKFGIGGIGYAKGGGYGGAGGGGWYGGSGSVPDGSGDDDRGGGGGSGFVFTSAAETNNWLPTGYLLNGEYYLTNTTMKSGTESVPSDGYVSGTTGRRNDGAARVVRIS